MNQRATLSSGSGWARIYLAFAALLLLAYWLPERSLDPVLLRTQYTIRACAVFLVAAFTLLLFRGVSPAVHASWRTAWVCGGVLYFVHVYWSVHKYFHGIPETFAGQGPWIAGGNFVITLWWALDIGLLMLMRAPTRFVERSRFALHVVLLAAFVGTAVFRKEGLIQYLGYGVVALVFAALVLRWLSHERDLGKAAS